MRIFARIAKLGDSLPLVVVASVLLPVIVVGTVVAASSMSRKSWSEPTVAFPDLDLIHQCAFAPTFTPDGRTMVFAVGVPDCGRFFTLVERHRRGAMWSRPRVLPFSGQYSDGDPSFSPDGKRMFFISDRPAGRLPNGETHRRDYDIWVADRSKSGEWSEPRHLGVPVNTDYAESSPSMASDGTLYFASRRPINGATTSPVTGLPGAHAFKLYRAHLDRLDSAAVVEQLPAPINAVGAAEVDPYISPDGRYLLFSSTRLGDASNGDLFVSCARRDSGWAEPKRILAAASPTWEFDPRISRDGHTLYFASFRGARLPDPRPEPWSYTDLRRWGETYDNGLGHLYEVPFEDPCAGQSL